MFLCILNYDHHTKIMSSNQPPKILYLITLSELGGAQKYVLDLATKASAEGFDVSVAVGGQPDGQLLTLLSRFSISSYYLRRLQRPLNLRSDFLAFFDICRLLRRLKPDIVHLNSSKAGSLGALAAKLCGVKKIIYTVHGLVLNEPLSAPKRVFYWLSEWFSGLFKTRFICVSAADQQALLKNKICRARKISVIHNGLDLAQINFWPRAEARAKLSLFASRQINDEVFLVGTLANFYPVKGLIYLIEAVKNVLPIYPQTKFIMIGSGPELPTFKKIVNSYRLEQNIIFTDLVPTASQYLKALDLFVLPSLKEGLPYALLEASAAGLPIIATAVGGNPEVVTDDFNGLLVPPADISSLTTALINLIPDHDRLARYAQNSQKRAQGFSLSSMAAQTFELYSL